MGRLGKCKVCESIQVVTNGVINEHNSGVFPKRKPCSGAGRPPK